jgi:hypothetical protein
MSGQCLCGSSYLCCLVWAGFAGVRRDGSYYCNIIFVVRSWLGFVCGVAFFAFLVLTEGR